MNIVWVMRKIRNISSILLVSCSLFMGVVGCQGGLATKKAIVIPEPEQGAPVTEKETAEFEAVAPAEKLSEKQIDDAFGIREDRPWSGLVRQRLHFYRQRVDNWSDLQEKVEILGLDTDKLDMWRQCGDFFREMVADYRQISGQDNQKKSRSAEQKDLWNLLSRDFIFHRHMDALADQSSPRPDIADGAQGCNQLMASRFFAVIKHHAARRQYDEGIEAYTLMKALVKEEEIPAGIKETYGQALLEKGRLAEALDIFMEVLAEDGGRMYKSLALRRETVGYSIALGDFDLARLQLKQIDEMSSFCCNAGKMGKDYEQLLSNSTDYELGLYGDALRSWLMSDRQDIPPLLRENVRELKRQAPDSEAARLGTLLQEQAERRVAKYVYRELSRAVELAQKNSFSQALEIVGSLNASSIPAESQQKVKATEAAIRKKQAQEKLRQEKIREEALADKWENAVNLLDSKEYDRALEHFRSLLDTGYRRQAAGKISEAVRLAATAKRQKAAELFIKARHTAKPERKIDFLQQSRQLLLEIKTKYPEAEVIDKVEKHLEVIEQSMREIHPALLQK